jgi:preprotein translocase subunit SecD
VLAQRYGLSPPPPGKNTQTALDLAIVAGHDMVAAFLREKGARTGEALWKKTRGTLAKRALEMRLAFDNPGEDTEQFHLITRSPGDQPSRRQVLHLQNETLLEESDIQTARVKNDPVTGSPHIELIFTYEGSTKFARITGENIGQKLAIIVDGEIISAPVIRAAISGGSAIISGDFTESEAGELARKITETTSSPGDVD